MLVFKLIQLDKKGPCLSDRSSKWYNVFLLIPRSLPVYELWRGFGGYLVWGHTPTGSGQKLYRPHKYPIHDNKGDIRIMIPMTITPGLPYSQYCLNSVKLLCLVCLSVHSKDFANRSGFDWFRPGLKLIAFT